jgi:hypothetical protein
MSRSAGSSTSTLQSIRRIGRPDVACTCSRPDMSPRQSAADSTEATSGGCHWLRRRFDHRATA